MVSILVYPKRLLKKLNYGELGALGEMDSETYYYILKQFVTSVYFS